MYRYRWVLKNLRKKAESLYPIFNKKYTTTFLKRIPETVEHGGCALGVHMDLVIAPRQLLLVLHPHQLEEVQMSVERLVLVLLQLFDDGLDAEHEQLVPISKSRRLKG